MTRKETIVYFAAAIRGDRALATIVQQLISFIKNDLHLPVLTEHIGYENPVDTLPAEAIEHRDIEWLNQATHVIAEISGASTGTGREIEYARTKHSFGHVPAKILCLYHTDAEFNASPMIRGMTADRYHNVTVLPYRAIEEAREIVKRFLA